MTEQESNAVVGRVYLEHKAAEAQLAKIAHEIARAKSQLQSFLTVDLNNLQAAKLPECLAGAQLGRLLDEYKTAFDEVTRLQKELSKF